MENNLSNINSTIKDFYHSERDIFIKDTKKFLTHYLTRISSILNHKEKILFPRLDLNDFQSHSKFLEDINQLCDNKNVSVGDSKIIYENFSDELFNNLPDELRDEDFINLFKPQKYTSGGKKQNINNNNDNNKESTPNRFIINYHLEKYFEIYFNCKNFLIENLKFVNNDFDIKYNFIIQNLMREDEGKNLPKGWIGLGLNVSELYKEDGDWLLNNTKTNQWIDGYIGIMNNIKYLTPNIIHNFAFNNEEFMEKANKENTKFYVYSNIESAKNEPKTITIGKIKYKFLLNVKVKKDEISQQLNEKIWYLDAKSIRVYRILFK